MTPVVIDTYRKDKKHKPSHGYGIEVRDNVWQRDRTQPPSSVVIHTTNNENKGTKFANEAAFIRDSADVSCHDLIAKDGTIAAILPASAVAWHAGTSRAEFHNFMSIGIEIHCSKGERPTQQQIQALTWRVKGIIEKFGVDKGDIETHRAIALPKGRKTDPEGWSDADFYAWRDTLFEPEWGKLWGRTNYYAIEHHGIPQAWRREHLAGRPLGQALTDEMLLTDGRVVQIFQDGAIWWTDTVYGVWR